VTLDSGRVVDVLTTTRDGVGRDPAAAARSGA
jgi:hypothetical protein